MVLRPIAACLALAILAACTAQMPPPVADQQPWPPADRQVAEKVADAPQRETAPAEKVNREPRPAYPGEKTRILSEVDAQRLLRNEGVSLQWIDWNRRGSLAVSSTEPIWTLRGAQSEADGPGRLFLDGAILEIGEGYFTFRGTIRITDTPDRGRQCEGSKVWHFAVTQHRPYYRLREFEWCDYLTDYVDVYFVAVAGRER